MPYWFPPAPTSPPNAKNVETLFDQTLCLFLEKKAKANKATNYFSKFNKCTWEGGENNLLKSFFCACVLGTFSTFSNAYLNLKSYLKSHFLEYAPVLQSQTLLATFSIQVAPAYGRSRIMGSVSCHRASQLQRKQFCVCGGILHARLAKALWTMPQPRAWQRHALPLSQSKRAHVHCGLCCLKVWFLCDAREAEEVARCV